jgi:diacylglycerol kinase (ATP)
VHRRGLDELGEDPAGGGRVQERDLRPADAAPRRLVDQPHPGRPQRVERAGHVVDPVGHMVEAGTPPGQEAADRCVLAEGGEQLHVALADVEQRGLHALVGQPLAVHERHAVRVAVNRDGGVQILDRDTDVIDAAEHGGECTLAAVRIALAANRASGGGLDPEPLAAAMRALGAEVEVFGCDPEDLERAAAAEPERVAVAGGDGTIGAAAALAGRLDVPLAVIPTGTANDFARANGIPADAREAAALAATGTATRPLELGRLADGRPFVNVASAGLATVAARNAQPLKPRLGPLAYAVGAARAAVTAKPLRATIRVDGDVAFDGPCWQAIVAVSGAFGGGSGVAEADPDDGVLDLVVLPAGTRIGLARRAWGLRARTIAQQRGIVHHRGHLVQADLPAGAELNVDGEIRADGLSRVTVEPHAFRLVVPTSTSPDGV